MFIVGMPRSGTTLVEQILASHPHIFGAGELPTMTILAAAVPAPDDPQAVADQSEADLAGRGRRYLDRVSALADGKMRVVAKMPENFAHAGLIRPRHSWTRHWSRTRASGFVRPLGGG